MADSDHLKRLRQGVYAWNIWRVTKPSVWPNLRGADLSEANLRGVNLSGANLSGANLSGTDLFDADLSVADFSGANLHGANLSGISGTDLRSATLSRANLSQAKLCKAELFEADLREADLRGADLSKAILVRARLFGAKLCGAILSDTDLRSADLREADLSGVTLTAADLSGATLSRATLSRANLTNCRVYSVSAWDLNLEGAKQNSLIITPEDQVEITVDDIEVAQFIYLLRHNEKIRRVIDTITTKAVLILGRFTPERKQVLDALRDELRKQDLLPIIFDFSIPERRDVTETIKVLAGLARFVIADITDATEVRVELHNIIRDFTSLPIQPILLRGQPEFVSMLHLKNFPWLLPTFEYDNQEHLLANLRKGVVSPAEAKALELRGEPG
jgi:uncharacterized protein YjbI with pentapeptide repeats